MQEINTSANPFPGLRPFESTETHLFFGRDGQSEELLRRLKRTRFLAVVGTSGSGKSSLVRAGLLPALQGGLMASAGSDWRIAILRPGDDPIGNLAHALSSPAVLGSREQSEDMQAALAETTLRRSSLGLAELVSRARMKLDDGGQPLFPDYENLLVVVDQFEELFRFKQLIEEGNSKEDAAAFVKLLLEAVRQKDEKIYVVLTMRSDFLGDCSQFWELPETINNGQYLIPRMTRDERREAITGPVAVGAGAISEPLVNQLLNDVGDNPDQLPIMQHALMRTWDYWLDHRRNGEPIDLPDYNAIGGMASALSRHADEAYEELNDAQKVIAEKLFKGLTEKGTDNREIRRPMELQVICELTGADEASVIAVVEVFRRMGRSFLMPPPVDALTGAPVPLNKESLIDISHESLIRNWERLKTWVDEESRSARIYYRLAETAVLHQEGRAGLWRDPDLQLALNWRDESRPNKAWASRYHPGFEEAMNFLDASVAARETAVLEAERQRRAQVKRARVTALVFGLAFLLALAALIFANSQRVKASEALREADKQRNEAIKQKEIAEGERHNAEAQARIANEESDKASKEKENAEKQKDFAEQKKLEADAQARIARENAQRAKLAGARAEEEKHNAETQARIARDEAEKSKHLLYAADINLAGQAYENNSIARGLELLEAHLPKPEQGDLRGFEWFRLWRLYHQDRATLGGHASVIASVAFSPDGKMLASGSFDKTVKLWDTKEHKELTTLKGHADTIRSVAFSPDGKTLATGSSDMTVKLWNLASPQESATLKGHTGVVNSVAFSPDGKMLASGSDDGTVKLWDTKEHKELATLKLQDSVMQQLLADKFKTRYTSKVNSVAFSPDGKTLAASNWFVVTLWNTTSYQDPDTLLAHHNHVMSIAFSPDGKTFATASYDGTVKLWDTASHKALATLEGHTGQVVSVAFSRDGKTLASGSYDGIAKIWDTASHEELATLRGHTGWITSVTFSPDGTLASGSYDATVKLWDSRSRREPATTLTGHEREINSVAFSPDGKVLASGSYDETVKLWDLASSQEPITLKGHTARVNSVAFSPDGKVLASGSDDGTVKLWDTTSRREPTTLKGHTGGVNSVAFSRDGKMLASGSDDGTVKLWSTKDFKELATLKGHTKTVYCVTFSPDGRTLASGSADYKVKLWDTKEHRLLATLEGESGLVISVAFSPDGKMLACGSAERVIVLWDTTKLQELARLKGHTSIVASVIFSPDGKTLASGSLDQTVKLWDTTSRRELATLAEHTDRVASVAFSPDGRTLASGSADKTVRLWRGATDAEVAAQSK